MLKRFAKRIIQNQTLMLLVLGMALLASLYIDTRNSLVLPSDMRNRMVGSRMLKDGLSPYYYVWKKGGPVRYFDTHIAPTSVVSAATSTPFFHWMISPVADFLQFRLNTFWFTLTYLLLAACWLLIALALPPRRVRLVLLCAVAIAFTYTTGWRTHLSVGQNYIFLPVMMSGCYYCLAQKRNGLHLLLFGLFAASLVLLRPIAVILFVPFLFYLKDYFRWFISATVWVVAYVVFVMTSPVQQKNWQDYFSSVRINVLLHQELMADPARNYPFGPEPITDFEGIDLATKGDQYWAGVLRKTTENSNFYILYQQLFGYKPSIVVQTGLGIFTCLLLLVPLWWVKKKQLPAPVEMLLLLGFMLLNTYEFFSPINRGNYAFVEFIFPMLLLVVFIRQLYIIPIVVLLLGLYLNIAVLPSVIMEHNIGQAMIELATLWLVYRPLIASRFSLTGKGKSASGVLWL